MVVGNLVWIYKIKDTHIDDYGPWFLNIMHFCTFLLDVVYLKFCSEWAANESYFCQFLRRRRRLQKELCILFLDVF